MTIVEKILKNFPEFKETEYYSDNPNLPYVFIPFFGDYLMYLVKNDKNQIAQRAIGFISDNYNSGDLEDKNQIWIGIFEVVGADAVMIDYLKSNLSGDALLDFEKFLTRTYTV